MLQSCISLEPDVYEFEEHALFDVQAPVWILGRQFVARNDFDQIKEFVCSRLWLTYRKNFPPIGGTGPTSDQGWGCMLRCGQMMLAEALLRLYVGADWRWARNISAERQEYIDILKEFADRKQALYSLHQIAQMGVSEGKLIGEWFGPNTVAQVLKKLAFFDSKSRLAVHVAMDNLVVLDDIYKVCAARCKVESDAGGSSCSNHTDIGSSTSNNDELGCPLLLLIPLRLGLTSLNECYLSAIQAFFALPQCVGIMGGRPNHALYFYGCIGNDRLLYLDPHTCQEAVNMQDCETSVNDVDDDDMNCDTVDANSAANDNRTMPIDDSTYHCSFILDIEARSVDPSLALGLLARNRQELDDMVLRLRKNVFPASQPPLFELMDKRPKGFPKFEPYSGEEPPKMKDYAVVEPRYDTDEEFEVLG